MVHSPRGAWQRSVRDGQQPPCSLPTPCRPHPGTRLRPYWEVVHVSAAAQTAAGALPVARCAPHPNRPPSRPHTFRSTGWGVPRRLWPQPTSTGAVLPEAAEGSPCYFVLAVLAALPVRHIPLPICSSARPPPVPTQGHNPRAPAGCMGSGHLFGGVGPDCGRRRGGRRLAAVAGQVELAARRPRWQGGSPWRRQLPGGNAAVQRGVG